MRKFLLSCFIICVISVKGQSIRDFYKASGNIQLGVPIKDTSYLVQDDDKYISSSGYRVPSSYKTLYGLPIQKVLVHLTGKDTVDAITVFLPFDSTLHNQIEDDLGASSGAWMTFPPGYKIDTSKIIWDRRWVLEDYIVVFSCTRYIFLPDEEYADDRIRIRIRRIKKR